MKARALAHGPTGIRGLIEFQWSDCGHDPYENGACPECVEHADRQQLTDALRTITHDGRKSARIGQTVLHEQDLRTLFEQLDRYDIALVRRERRARWWSWLISDGPTDVSRLDRLDGIDR